MKRVFLLAAFFAVSAGLYAQSHSDEHYRRVADRVHKKYVTIDTHNDTAMYLNHPDDEDYTVTKGQVDFPKMKEGGLDAAFFAIYLSQGPLRESSRDSVFAYAMNEIKLFKEYVAQRSDEAAIAYTPDEVREIKKSGKRCVIFALENGYGVGLDLNRVDSFFRAGARYITLCHNYTNDICDASRYPYARYGDSPQHGGLSKFGKEVIGRMNELGMMVDVSHASSDVLWQAIETSKAPIVATHSSARAIKNNARNLTDEEIIAIAKQGGVIQVATGRFFLSDLPKKEVTIKHLADHIDYIKNLVGIEHVGIGTDYDGGGGVVGMEDCSKMKDLTIELLRRGYTEKELGLFWGENFLRVWQKVIDVAEELQKEKK